MQKLPVIIEYVKALKSSQHVFDMLGSSDIRLWFFFFAFS